jgi:hypothetical protein
VKEIFFIERANSGDHLPAHHHAGSRNYRNRPLRERFLMQGERAALAAEVMSQALPVHSSVSETVADSELSGLTRSGPAIPARSVDLRTAIRWSIASCITQQLGLSRSTFSLAACTSPRLPAAAKPRFCGVVDDSQPIVITLRKEIQTSKKWTSHRSTTGLLVR